jgi:ABC-type sugar transport system substrate-binding protein
MSDAGLTTDRYWIGSNNGLEQSWQWAKDGKISMDVDQPPMMEGALLYQMLKAYFSGQEYRKHLCPYLIPYTKANISEVEPALVPVSDINRFIEKINGNAIVWDINDKNFIDLPGNWD